MKKQNFLIVVFITGLFFSCGSLNNGNANSPEYRQMLEKVQDLNFTIENQWANPVKYSRVNLMGNPNHISFEGDSVDLFLPFFGERQAGGGYGSEGAIQYEGPLEDLRIEERPEKNQVVLSFNGNNKSENLNFRVTIFPNGNTTTSVTSSQRDQINYDGKIKRMK